MKSNLLYIADYKNEEFHEKLMSSLYDALENYSILTEEEKSNLDIDVEFFELDKVYTTPHLLNDDVLYIRVRFGRSDYIARYKNGILVIWIDDHITHVDFCFGE
ncbi:hypothetical protein, partial [Xenorhabdus bovienii]|uniref:hypothetical protein n=1 Tax=Xenorhabdus bovienii TaxID=40576 RepID=UPI0023B20CE6